MMFRSPKAKRDMQGVLSGFDAEIAESEVRRAELSAKLFEATEVLRQNIVMIYKVPIESVRATDVSDDNRTSVTIGAVRVVYEHLTMELRLLGSNSRYQGPFTIGLKVTDASLHQTAWDVTNSIDEISQLSDSCSELCVQWALDNKEGIKQIRQKFIKSD